MLYNWQQEDWREFRYRLEAEEEVMIEFAESRGRVAGMLQGLPEEARTQTLIDLMVAEAIKTSEIEGAYLSREDVLSSIRNNLGLNKIPEQVKDRRASGVARLMVAVRETFGEELSKEMLFSWHIMIMEGSKGINKGQWRSQKEPMQVVSGPAGREEVHFEAPPSENVPGEMENFIRWFNETSPGGKRVIKNPLLRSAIAHVYFETIHPFEDGNGRIGRALSEKALSQGVGRPVLLSLSRAIEAKRKNYYSALKNAQRSNEITTWIGYFVQTVMEAQHQAETQIEFTLKKTRFFDRYRGLLNERQEKVLRRMLEEGPDGFKGGMNAKKYITLTKTSKSTATRDLQQLVELRVFISVGGGRSVRYDLSI